MSAVGTRSRAARAEASVWIVRLHSEARTPEVEAGLRQWLAAHPDNAREFEHITDVWDIGGSVTADGLPRMRAWKSTAPYKRWVFAAAALGVVGLLGWFAANWHSAEPAYATAHGEQRLVRLADGSRVSMNSDTRLAMEFSATERRVRLERGEGFFEVAKDSSRPFIVLAGERRITALGTTFVVRYEAASTAITLVDGKIAVAADAHEPQRILAPGERLTLDNGLPARLDSPRIDALTAWRRGEVLLGNTRLADAVVEMNRYDARQLVLDAPELADVRVSGVYRTGDSPGFARAVAELHGLRLVESAEAIHLRRPAD